MMEVGGTASAVLLMSQSIIVCKIVLSTAILQPSQDSAAKGRPEWSEGWSVTLENHRMLKCWTTTFLDGSSLIRRVLFLCLKTKFAPFKISFNPLSYQRFLKKLLQVKKSSVHHNTLVKEHHKSHKDL